jgi:uncharacterized protein (DUF1778 family)
MGYLLKLEVYTMSKDRARQERLGIRLDPEEKKAFEEAAEIAGVPVSAWVRERLRRVARRELEEANRAVPFLKGKV